MVGHGVGEGVVTATFRAALVLAASDRAKATFRMLFLLVLAGVLLRLLGSRVGAWAEGSLGTLTTLFIGVVAPAWLLVFFPTWLAWRSDPSHRPATAGRRRVLVLSPRRGYESWPASELFSIWSPASRCERPTKCPPMLGRRLAAAVQAERHGDRARAQQILDALKYLPTDSGLPWLARLHGVEALLMAAWCRRDLSAIAAHASLGRGRVVRLLALLAQLELGRTIAPRKLWACWALAAHRRVMFRAVQRAVARQSLPARVTPAPADPPAAMKDVVPAADVRLRHLSLLAAAGRGEDIPVRHVLALTAAWQAHLDGAALARLSARALELDVRDASGRAHLLRETVLDELTALAAAGEGELPAAGSGEVLVSDLVARVREQLLQQAESALALLDPGAAVAKIHPLEAWQRWLMLAAVVERLARLTGSDAAVALWNARVNTTVWNWACAIFNCHSKRGAWVAHMMYLWVAERAEIMGDVRTTVVNRENARIVLGA